MADEYSSSPKFPDSPPPRTTGGNWRWEPPTAEELQSLMPGYTIEKILGRGGMGAVYRGVQTNLDRPVAIKILPPGVEKEDPSFAERFKSEARLMAKLNHPAVVAVYDFGTTSAGQLYFAMEYVDGSDVSQMIASQGRLPPEHALAITAHVCDALSAAHELGIVHRDIKPANVLLNMKGQVKVADFGLAKIEDPGQHGLTKTGYAMGTPDFVAPEALMLGTAIDGRADIYAVGVMLYQMLTGNIPRGAFKPAFVLVSGLDPRFDPIITKAMQHDREERYQSSEELRRDLDVILTVPLVQQNAPESAAIPVSQVAQLPAQRSAAQKPAAKSPPPKSSSAPPSRQAAASSATGGTPASKSKAPLFIGLGVAAALGIGAFKMMGGRKDAGGVAGTPAATPAPTKTASTSPAASFPASSGIPSSAYSGSTAPLSLEQWKQLFPDENGQSKAIVDGYQDGMLKIKGAAQLRKKMQTADGIVRALAHIRAGTGSVAVFGRSTPDGYYHLILPENEPLLYLSFRKNDGTGRVDLGSFPLSLHPGDAVLLELRIQEDRLTAAVNGKAVITAHDSKIQSPGEWGIKSASKSDVWFSRAEIESLGQSNAPSPVAAAPNAPSSSAPSIHSSPAPKAVASTAPQAIASTAPQFPPGKWVKMFTMFEELPEELRKPDSGVKFEDGWINLGLKWLSLPWAIKKDYALRARFRRGPGNGGTLTARHDVAQNSSTLYQSKLSDGYLVIQKREGEKYSLLSQAAMPKPQPGAEYALEFGVLGNRLIGRSGIEGFSFTQNTEAPMGVAAIYGGDLVRDIEVINLDGLSEAEALKILGVDEKGNDLRKPAAVASTTAATDSPSPPLPKPADTFPPGQWVKVFAKAEDLSEGLRERGVKFENGWLVPQPDKVAKHVWQDMGNAGLRATYLKPLEASGLTPKLAIRSKGMWETGDLRACELRFNGEGVSLMDVKSSAPRSSKEEKLASMRISPDEWAHPITIELLAMGPHLVAFVNNRLVGKLSNAELPLRGQLYFESKGHIRDIEVINLDGLSEAEALKILGVDEKGNDLRATALAQEKMQDAASAIPELKALHDQFVKLSAERVTTPFEADVAKLNAGYAGGIDRKIAEETAAGHLDGILALEAEKKLLAERQPIPAEDPEGSTASLKALRTIYRAAYAKIDAARAANLRQLTDPLSLRLKQLETDLTKQKRVSDAKNVREYREGLGKEATAGAKAEDKITGSANKAESARTPLKKFPPGDDRKAAEWALDMGGSIVIRDVNGMQTIQAKGSLPKRPFDLLVVSLAASDRANRQTIEYTGLLPLAGLRKLNNVSLSSIPVTDDDTEILASLPELNRLQLSSAPGFTGKRLALLKDSTKVTWMNLGSNGITPEGIEQITQFTHLTGLQLNGTYLGDGDLAPLARLKKLNSLNLNDTKVTLEGWKQLKGLPLTELSGLFVKGASAEWCKALAALFPKVRKLEISSREAVAAEDVAAVTAFPELRELIFASSFLDDASLSALTVLTQLESLRLRAGSAGPVKNFTDAGVDSLLSLKKLNMLRLEKISPITPAALMKLTKLKSLQTLEIVSCDQLDVTAIAAFKKERPDVSVTN